MEQEISEGISLVQENKTDEDIFVNIAWTTDTITIIASCIFFYGLYKSRNQRDSLYMIRILTVADFIYPASNIIGVSIISGDTATEITTCITSTVYQFTIFWSASIAIFLHSVYSTSFSFEPSRFLRVNFFACLLMSLLFPFL